VDPLRGWGENCRITKEGRRNTAPEVKKLTPLVASEGKNRGTDLGTKKKTVPSKIKAMKAEGREKLGRTQRESNRFIVYRGGAPSSPRKVKEVRETLMEQNQEKGEKKALHYAVVTCRQPRRAPQIFPGKKPKPGEKNFKTEILF